MNSPSWGQQLSAHSTGPTVTCLGFKLHSLRGYNHGQNSFFLWASVFLLHRRMWTKSFLKLISYCLVVRILESCPNDVSSQGPFGITPEKRAFLLWTSIVADCLHHSDKQSCSLFVWETTSSGVTTARDSQIYASMLLATRAMWNRGSNLWATLSSSSVKWRHSGYVPSVVLFFFFLPRTFKNTFPVIGESPSYEDPSPNLNYTLTFQLPLQLGLRHLT